MLSHQGSLFVQVELKPFLAVQWAAKTSPLLLRGQEERTSLDVVDFHGKSQRHRPCFPSAVVCVPPKPTEAGILKAAIAWGQGLWDT